jgi:hypothetical protein
VFVSENSKHLKKLPQKLPQPVCHRSSGCDASTPVLETCWAQYALCLTPRVSSFRALGWVASSSVAGLPRLPRQKIFALKSLRVSSEESVQPDWYVGVPEVTGAKPSVLVWVHQPNDYCLF